VNSNQERGRVLPSHELLSTQVLNRILNEQSGLSKEVLSSSSREVIPGGNKEDVQLETAVKEVAEQPQLTQHRSDGQSSSSKMIGSNIKDDDHTAIHLLLGIREIASNNSSNSSKASFPDLPSSLTLRSPSNKRKYNDILDGSSEATTIEEGKRAFSHIRSSPLLVNILTAVPPSDTTFLASTPSNRIGNTNKKEEINILHHFEPRFYQIYQTFSSYCVKECHLSLLNPKNHLLSLCLEYMILFCSWARDASSFSVGASASASSSVSSWLKVTLDDNPDLRPEVRNGLAMILMYCFASAQSKLRGNDCDMFITLQDNENGLGIVNKTSLKIYNDPYEYFNFLKNCITGLIDAGKIPENERVNKVFSFLFFYFFYLISFWFLVDCFVSLSFASLFIYAP
jgi:hypothetical protein